MLKAENLIPRSRYLAVNAFIILVVLVLMGRFFMLQVLSYEKYKFKAESNRIRVVPLDAPRGLVRDRNGHILVDNYPTYVLYGIAGEIKNKQDQFRTISISTGIDTLTLAENFSKFYRSRFLPTKLAKDLTFSQLSRLEENRINLPGVLYKQYPERFYSQNIRASHLLGYLKELESRNQEKTAGEGDYELGDLVGWRGLEKQYENHLRGVKGAAYFEVDALGREVGKIEERPDLSPSPGTDLVTTLDLDLQRVLEKELSGYRGVGVLSNPETGEILACASMPDYEPELFRGTTSNAEWEGVIADTQKPLLNRFTNGLYPPGSTFKILTTIALLKNRKIDPEEAMICSANYEFGDRVFRCWNELGHGSTNLEKALAQSCNIYFYQAVQRLSLKQLEEVWKEFGFGQATGIDLPTELTGIVPNRELMNRLYGRRGWARGNILNLALGQGELLVTPVQMALYINHLATRGRAGKLHFSGKPGKSESSPIYDSRLWELIEHYMQRVVYDARGTGRFSNPKIDNLTLAGKTGTAENPHGEPHAWFIGYGRKEGDLVSLVLLIENGGSGGEVAAPKARRIFKQVFQSGTKGRVANL